MDPTTELLPILAVIDVKKLKNGNSKISFPSEKASNIYSIFKNEGFAYVELSGKAVLVQRGLNGIEQVSIDNLRDSFEHYLKNVDYFELPADVTYHKVMDTYYQNAFLKSNNKLKAYLTGHLSDEELHTLLLKTDHQYRKAHQLQTMLEQLENTRFKLTEDKISTYHKNDRHLYYKHIGENDYIVFNDIDDPKIKLRMFDCWISKFTKESDIGKKHPLSTSSVMIDFKWDRDYQLIASYLN
jgi:hypothetical protein